MKNQLVSAGLDAAVAKSKQTKKYFTFWLFFGLSPNLGLFGSLGERLSNK